MIDLIYFVDHHCAMSKSLLADAEKRATNKYTRQDNITVRKAAHGLACEADWDYLAYSEPEARLFLSRAISVL